MRLMHGNKAVANDVVIFKNAFSKAIGLRFKHVDRKKAYVFPVNNSRASMVDTFFMASSIDIVFLDNDFKVIGIKRNVRPFNMVMPEKGTRFIVEMRNAGNVKFDDKVRLSGL